MSILSTPRRPRRPGEWNDRNSFIFIVTLATGASVTLAARKAGMSRKAAYALKARDPAFATAWSEARKAAKGHEVEEIKVAPPPLQDGDSRKRSALSTLSTSPSPLSLTVDAARRDAFLARLRRITEVGRAQAAVARHRPLP